MAATPAIRRRYAPRLSPARRREHLLDCALRILVRDGYEAISVGAIAAEAGVTRPVVYSAYEGGLAALTLALLKRTQARAHTQVVETMERAAADSADGGPEEWARAMATGLIERAQADPEVWRPVLGLVHGTPAVVREHIEATRDQLHAALAARLAAAGTGGDTEVLARILMASAEECMRLALADPPRYPPERMVEALVGLVR